MLIFVTEVMIIVAVRKQFSAYRPVVDVLQSPDSRAERINQLLLNQIVTCLDVDKDFGRIRSRDGYVGWARMDHLTGAVWTRPSHFVDVPVATLLDDNTGRFVGKLSFGTRILLLERNGSFARMSFSGKRAWISLGCIRKIFRKSCGWRTVRAYLGNLVGTPYLWGGRSGFGLDCSGLVQLVYGACGYDLPRDSLDQKRRGRKVSMAKLEPGDLIFSPGHVCVYCGSGRIIHSSQRVGGVYIENLLPDMPDSRTDIFDEIEVAKRVMQSK
jgi:hypothetical protein